ncbi:MAG TPA: DnaJ domain-containing protein [Thermoanaerobaculia bacterium]|nr:DnaJ domain-containing protein [Thermoanaerobaculia bacterium]
MESPTSSAQRPTDEELRLFLNRIGRQLADHPTALDPAAHREQVAALLRQAGDVNFYQLLGLPATARAQEVHEAFDRIARLVHPVNAGRLGLNGREGVLELLFERLTLAYLTLFQIERRKVYDRDLDPAAWSAAPGCRREEARGVAQGYYERALALSAEGDYHFAIELVQQAVRIDDSRPEYPVLLGKLQARNSRWLRAAAESLEQGAALGSRDPELPPLLATVRERLAAGEALQPPTAAAAAKKKEAPDVEVVAPGDDEFDVPWPTPNKRDRW